MVLLSHGSLRPGVHHLLRLVSGQAVKVKHTLGLVVEQIAKGMALKILFLHGWHSVVGGVKPTYLANQGNEVCNPRLDDDDFSAALATAQQAFDRFAPDVVVGSSRGGALAMNVQSGTTPLVLLCPAWRRWGNATSVKPNTLVLHSRQDEVIPFDDSVQLVHDSRLPMETLIETGSDHRLADEQSLAVMQWACQMLSSGTPLPWGEGDEELDDARRSSQEEGAYTCDACGEEIVIPLDVSEGSHQRYVEDCPVCCRANVIHVEIDEDGQSHVWAEPEQDGNP
jgi:hypothetical protein